MVTLAQLNYLFWIGQRQYFLSTTTIRFASWFGEISSYISSLLHGLPLRWDGVLGDG